MHYFYLLLLTLTSLNFQILLARLVENPTRKNQRVLNSMHFNKTELVPLYHLFFVVDNLGPLYRLHRSYMNVLSNK